MPNTVSGSKPARAKETTGLLVRVGCRHSCFLVHRQRCRKEEGVPSGRGLPSLRGVPLSPTLQGGGEGGTDPSERVPRVPQAGRDTRNAYLPGVLAGPGAPSPACPPGGQGHESPCMSPGGRGDSFRGRRSWAGCDGGNLRIFEALFSFLDDSASILGRKGLI